MNAMNSKLSSKLVAALSTLALLMTVGMAQAAQFTWTAGNNGGDSIMWDTSSANWSGGAATLWDAANGPTNDALFTTSPAVTVSGTVFTNGIEFTTGSVGTTISGGTINLAGTSPFISFSGSTTTGGAGSTASVATISSTITGSGGLTFNQLNSIGDNSRRLTLSGANSYTGGTTIDSIPRDYFRLRAGNPLAFGLPTEASITILPRTGQDRAIVELFGNDITVIGLNYAGGNDGGPPAFGGFLYNTHATDDATLTLDTSTADSTFTGALRDEGGGALGLTIVGGGKLTLNPNNVFHDYTGGLTIQEGTLAVVNFNGAVLGTGGIVMGGSGTNGILQLTNGGAGTITTNQAVTLVAGGTGTFDAATATTRLTSIVSGDGDLAKTGNGGLTLAAVNTYTGDTTVSAGTLTLEDNAGLSFEIGASGVNNGISGTGILSLLGDFYFDLSGASASLGDLWNIVNVATLNETFGASFEVNGFVDAGSDLWTFDSGSATYTFSEASGMLAVTAVAAAPTPEPSTLILAVCGLVSFVASSRRKRRRD